MLSKAKAYAVVPVSSLTRATKWYEDKLGFTRGETSPAGCVYAAGGGSMITLYETPNAGKSPATLLSFEVSDFDGEMADLKKRGVAFEDYDMPGLKTVNGVATFGPVRSAWFKDPDGNILSIVKPR